MNRKLRGFNPWVLSAQFQLHPPNPRQSVQRYISRMHRLITFALAVALVAPRLSAQQRLQNYGQAIQAQHDRTQPVVRYVIRVDTTDLTGWSVELHLRNVPDTIRLALPVWAPGAYRVVDFARNIQSLTARVGDRVVPVTPDGASRWRIVAPSGGVASAGAPMSSTDVVVSYRLVYPSVAAAVNPNNRSFLRATGGLVDGPPTFVYLSAAKLAPLHVTFDIPAGWRVMTGLEPTADPRTFFAASYDVLIDSPSLVAPTPALRWWTTLIDGVPHRIGYWSQPGAPSFDTTTMVNTAVRMMQGAHDIMGRFPYREYMLMYIDGVGSALEHQNSTTIPAPSASMVRDASSRAAVTAHEFFHLWNIKRVRPVELGPFDYQQPVRSTGLWWSEGVTDFFAAEIQRRTGVVNDSSARAALAGLIRAYVENPAHTRISPERSSVTVWDRTSVNGGYSISYYLQGALLGELIELQMRSASAQRRGMDDVMRLLFDRHAGARGFTSADLERAINDACRCNLSPFYRSHVRAANEIDFDRYLGLMGMRAEIRRQQARDASGQPLPDLRIGATPYGGIGTAGGPFGGRPRLAVGDPGSAWGKAGLETGDEVISVNGKPVDAPDQLRPALAGVRVGDTVRVEYLRAGERRVARVAVGTYDAVSVSLVDAGSLTATQRAVREVWMRGPRRP